MSEPSKCQPQPDARSSRQRWMSAFARLSPGALEELEERLGRPESAEVLRPAETGLVMLRARAGGSGQRFNLGEMTVTRCSLRAADGSVGHGYVAGRDKMHATRAARLDLRFQGMSETSALAELEDLERAIDKAADARQQRSAPTKVDFFTLVRGEV